MPETVKLEVKYTEPNVLYKVVFQHYSQHHIMQTLTEILACIIVKRQQCTMIN